MVSIKSERHAIIALISIININVPAWCVCVCVCCILSICSLPNGLSILFQWKMVVQPLANMYRMAANLTYFLFHTQTHQCTSVSGHKCVSLLQIAISLSLVLFIPWFVIFFSLALFLFHLISRLVHFSHFDWPCVCVCVDVDLINIRSSLSPRPHFVRIHRATHTHHHQADILPCSAFIHQQSSLFVKRISSTAANHCWYIHIKD